jgi:hypothetical protein
MKRWGGPLDAPSYRLLFLDPVTGWIEHYDEFEATSDEDAAAYARTHAEGRRVELWRGHHRLLQLPATPAMMLRPTAT